MKIAIPLITLGCLVSCHANVAPATAGEAMPAAEAAAAIDVTKPETLVGHPLKDVQAACDAAEIRHRVIEIDGEPQPATRDYRPERLNFAVKKGVVTAVTKG